MLVISDSPELQPLHSVQHCACCANLAYLEASLGQLMKCLLFTEFSSDLPFSAGIGSPSDSWELILYRLYREGT